MLLQSLFLLLFPFLVNSMSVMMKYFYPQFLILSARFCFSRIPFSCCCFIAIDILPRDHWFSSLFTSFWDAESPHEYHSIRLLSLDFVPNENGILIINPAHFCFVLEDLSFETYLRVCAFLSFCPRRNLQFCRGL